MASSQCYRPVEKTCHQGQAHHNSLAGKVSHFMGHQAGHTTSCQTTCHSQNHHIHPGHATYGHANGHGTYGYGNGHGNSGYNLGHAAHGHGTSAQCTTGHASQGHGTGHCASACNGKSHKKGHRKNFLGRIKEKFGDSSCSESESDSDDDGCRRRVVLKGLP